MAAAANYTGRFSDEVEKALKEVLPSDDPLDAPDFDPVEFINARFPSERSLDGLDGYVAEIRRSLADTEGRLLDAVKVQATTASSAAQDLRTAKEAVQQLHHRVSDIKQKAEASEAMVASICDGIRHLDTAKSNLSTSIKTLRNLQLYIISLQSLSAAYEAKDFSRCNDSLRSAQGYRAKFKSLEETPKIRELADKLSHLEKQLEFHLRNHAIGEMRTGQAGGMSEDQLREACLVVDALGPEVQAKVRAKFIATQLEPYSTLFRRGTEDAALERTERRFAFIRKLLETNERFFLHVFPRHWCVPQELCVEFCLRTHKELAHQLREEAGSVDIAVLVFILQRTIEAEKDLTLRMRHLQAEIDDDDDNLDFDPVPGAASGKPPLPEYRYYGMIVRCFDAHMAQYVQHEDRMLERTIGEIVDADSVVEDLLTLQSSQDLFLFIQESKHRASTFAQSQTISDLSAVWLKHLIGYAQLLINKVATVPTTEDQVALYCVVINSADYCRGATEGLCEDLTKLLEGDIEALKHLFEDSTEAFVKLSSVANNNLVEAFCARLNTHVVELQNFIASTLGADHAHSHVDALDESPSGHAMRKVYRELVYVAAAHLHPHCFPYLVNKTAATFVPKYWARLVYNPKSGRHTDLAISQLRLDCSALEKWLLSTPTDILKAAAQQSASAMATGAGSVSRASVLGSARGSDAAADGGAAGQASGVVVLTGYHRTVKREMSYVSAALKVLQLEAGDAFVQLYYAATPPERRSLSDCGRLLELKGVKPDDTRQLLALLRRHADVPRGDGAGPMEPASRSSVAMAGAGGASPAASSPTSAGPSGRLSGLLGRQPSQQQPDGARGHHDGEDDDGPGAALRRKFREISVGKDFISRLKRGTN
jgi:hypothetical protein